MPNAWRKFPIFGKPNMATPTNPGKTPRESAILQIGTLPAELLASAPRGNPVIQSQGVSTMNTTYKAGDFRHTVAAIACAVVFGSTFLFGAVAPAHMTAAPVAVGKIIA
jgi:hypothetical protein